MKTPMNLGHALQHAETHGGHFLDYMKPSIPTCPDGMRLLSSNEVPAPGDYFKWNPADSGRGWQLITAAQSNMHGLPVLTIRHRCGQDQLEFCARAALQSPKE